MTLAIRKQSHAAGPLTHTFDTLAHTKIGKDIFLETYDLDITVVIAPINGNGVCPCRNTVILGDTIIGSMETRHQVLVAHELVHVLQRNMGPDLYFPDGYFRPTLNRRWIGDSTNYMEVLAYLAQYAIKYELTSNALVKEDIRRDIVAITGDNRAACWYIVEKYYWSKVYQKNLERDDKQNRYPESPWYSWFKLMGFSDESVFYIFDIMDGIV